MKSVEDWHRKKRRRRELEGEQCQIQEYKIFEKTKIKKLYLLFKQQLTKSSDTLFNLLDMDACSFCK